MYKSGKVHNFRQLSCLSHAYLCEILEISQANLKQIDSKISRGGGTPHTKLENKPELARFSTALRIQDRAECDKGIGLHLGGGDFAQTKLILGGGAPHIFR